MFRYLVVLAFLAAAIPAAQAEDDPLHVATAIDQEYDKVFDAGDAAGLTAFYTDDATVIAPAAKAVTGSEALLKFWQTVLNGKSTNHKFEVVSAQPLSDATIIAIAHWSVDFTDGSGKVIPVHGDAAQLFVKTDKGWKIKLVGWNVASSR